jgi:uncharacterized protein (UPF0179 family)
MITLIGKDLAKKDLVFLFNGAVKDCETCKFKSACVESLEKGRLYKILNVKENTQKCKVHDENMVKVVDVEESEIITIVDSKKSFKGSSIVYNSPDCDINCKNHKFCFAEGLKENDSGVIEDVLEKHINCPKGYSFNKIIFKREY